MKTLNYLILPFLICCPFCFNAQVIIGDLKPDDPKAHHIVKLYTGPELEGRVVAIEETTLFLLQGKDTMQIELSTVKKITVKNDLLPIRPSSKYPSTGVDTAGQFLLQLKNGSHLHGKLIDIEKEYIFFRFQQQRIKFHKSDVQRLLNLPEEGNDTLSVPIYSSAPHGHQNVVASPTAFVPDGVDYQTHYGLLHQVEFPIGKHASLMTSYSVPDLLIGKLKFASNNVDKGANVGGGILLISSLFTDLGTIVIPHLSFTLGNPNNYFNFVVGRSWLYYGGNDPDKATLVSIGGRFVMGGNWHVLTETFFHTNEYGTVTIPSVLFGIIKNRNRFFFGGFVSFDDGYVFPFPMINYGHAF